MRQSSPVAISDSRLALTGSTVLIDRKSTRLNSSHRCISYAVFCLKKKKHRVPCKWVDYARAYLYITRRIRDARYVCYRVPKKIILRKQKRRETLLTRQLRQLHDLP